MTYYKLTFCGGAGAVTGANFLLESKEGNYLIDCGLNQGDIEAYEKNAQAFLFDPQSIDALFVTHAHIDHIGRIPKLVKEGFKGKIYSTPPTKELAYLMLLDAYSVMETDYQKNNAIPWYDREDIESAMNLWETYDYYTPFKVNSCSIEFKNAGHILGSSIIIFDQGGSKIVFTGDLGNKGSLLMQEPDHITDATYMIMESVYGDREHESVEGRTEAFKKIIQDTIRRKGTLVIPVFSLERTQMLLYELNELIENNEVRELPVFLDSPLAIKVTEVYKKYPHYFNTNVQEDIRRGDNIFDFPRLKFTNSKEESKLINEVPGPKIVLAGSGMSHAGRVIFHEKRYLHDPSSTILLVGYQVPGGIGRKLQNGAKEVVILGTTIPVRAHVETLLSYSGHADRNGLLEFAEHTAKIVKQVFVAMGEPKASTFLAQRLRDFLGINAVVPKEEEEFILKVQ